MRKECPHEKALTKKHFDKYFCNIKLLNLQNHAFISLHNNHDNCFDDFLSRPNKTTINRRSLTTLFIETFKAIDNLN